MSLDPRAKMVTIILINVALVSTSNITLIILIALLSILPLLKYRSFFSAIGSLRNWMLLAYLAFLVNAHFRGPFFGIAMALRLFSLVISSQLFFLSTRQAEIVRSFRALGLGEDYTIALSIALRFIPVIGEDAQLMADALRAKKVKYHFINKLRYSVAYLAAIISRTMYRVSAVAETLETRGFWEKMELSTKWKLKDTLLVLAGAGILSLSILDAIGYLNITSVIMDIMSFIYSRCYGF